MRKAKGEAKARETKTAWCADCGEPREVEARSKATLCARCARSRFAKVLGAESSRPRGAGRSVTEDARESRMR